MDRSRTSATPSVRGGTTPFRPTRLFWIAIALDAVGVALALWGRLELNEIVAAENAAGREHGVQSLFRLTFGWLAAFWIGLVMALAGSTILVVSIL